MPEEVKDVYDQLFDETTSEDKAVKLASWRTLSFDIRGLSSSKACTLNKLRDAMIDALDEDFLVDKIVQEVLHIFTHVFQKLNLTVDTPIKKSLTHLMYVGSREVQKALLEVIIKLASSQYLYFHKFHQLLGNAIDIYLQQDMFARFFRGLESNSPRLDHHLLHLSLEAAYKTKNNYLFYQDAEERLRLEKMINMALCSSLRVSRNENFVAQVLRNYFYTLLEKRGENGGELGLDYALLGYIKSDCMTTSGNAINVVAMIADKCLVKGDRCILEFLESLVLSVLEHACKKRDAVAFSACAKIFHCITIKESEKRRIMRYIRRLNDLRFSTAISEDVNDKIKVLLKIIIPDVQMLNLGDEDGIFVAALLKEICKRKGMITVF